MYISVRYLRDRMGVDESLARFFVDREVPKDNAFWKGRLLYIGRGNGFVSIPVYYDLLRRLGVSKEILLAEEHILLMQDIMHYAILAECKQISFQEHLEKIRQLLVARPHNELFMQELLDFLSQPILKPAGRLGMAVPALNRADVFLFILCDIPLSGIQIDNAIRYWYALHSSYLLMDDLVDYAGDKEAGEENSVVELGDSEKGFGHAFKILEENADSLSEINDALSDFLKEQWADLRALFSKMHRN